MHEQEVLALLRAGDERGAEALLRHYAPLMRYIIAPIVPDAQDREECLSDAALVSSAEKRQDLLLVHLPTSL